MNKKQLLPFFCVLTLMPALLKAQTVSPDVLNKYPASVVARVYEVTSKIQLSSTKQKELAAHYLKEDSLSFAFIQSGASKTSMDSLSHAMRTEFQHIITAKGSNDYYTALLNEGALIEGRIVAKQAQQKFGCDSAITNTLSDLYYKRRLNVDKVFYSQFTDSAVLLVRLSKVIESYDTLLDKYLYAASSTAYIKGKIAVLDNIKPLTAAQKNDLQSSFVNFCVRYKEKNFGDNFHAAMHKVITDTSYYGVLYKDKIETQAKIRSQAAISDLVKKNKITNENTSGALTVLQAKYTAQEVIIQAYPTLSHKKDSLLAIVNHHYDSVLQHFSPQRDSILSSSQFAIALKFQKQLALTDDQISVLKTKGKELKQLRDSATQNNTYVRYDTRSFESEVMNKVLTEKQYNGVLVIRNLTEAKSNAAGNWEEIELRGLASKYNKDSTISQLTKYHLARLGANCRYANDKIKLSANLRSIDARMPAALRTLKASQKNGTSQGNFQW